MPEPEKPAAPPDEPPASTPEPEKPAAAAEQPPPATPDKEPPAGAPDPRESMCLMIESAARANGLPLEFFARVIWQESRFQPNAVGPMTRSGARAQGIAQFMPGTAAERRLLDPFDPVQALPKSAEFLAELRNKFGNLGLAAAAYNAGPQRVRDWMAGTRTLPGETRRYVLAITGTPADDWARGAKGEPGQPGQPNCRQLMALLKRAPNPFIEKLQERINLVAASPWGIQLAAGFSRDRALASYATMAKRYARGAGRPRSEHPEQRAAQPRHAAVLPGARGRADPRRRQQAVRRHPARRRLLPGAAQSGRMTGAARLRDRTAGSERLGQTRLAQNGISGVPARDADGHGEVSLRDRAAPDFVAAFALANERCIRLRAASPAADGRTEEPFKRRPARPRARR